MPIKDLPGLAAANSFLHFSSAAGAFTQRLTHLQERHQGKPGLIKRPNDAGLTAE
ncbi:hypothetical protein [Nonomuraea sp. GTA35]|uniref:hypothetical protein n=1 Tax=Nonomuraea sp. GTA35 TaxID=1676746 RepID=UPI0035C1FE18